MIGSKISRQFFNQREAEAKPIAPGMRDFSGALTKLQVHATHSDWFIALFAHAVTGWGHYFGIAFPTVI